ncbi:protein yciN [Yersinia aldovae]|uniref:YciN family protein n=1 Tax=Yersinia aldovae TaxID=29483 RepID=UPI0005E6F837|nr:YciN family protein [Yersinia aldovae]CNH35958.1 protein yciN [Yersinia aldovae]
MNTNTTPIERNKLLAEANNIIRQHEGYLHGMLATEVEQKGPVLVFRGEFFLDEDGLPTTKTTAVFNMFKHLAHVLSAKYHLVD